ncbi:hypothetical protein [Pseudomonas sp.]|uniref:hypothetical protein n=1 Tax=Pseudomonas sp. TaxID=306 RepID=UPI003FD6DC4D
MKASEIASEALDLVRASYERCTQMAALFRAISTGMEHGCPPDLMTLSDLGNEIITDWANHLDTQETDLQRSLNALETAK